MRYLILLFCVGTLWSCKEDAAQIQFRLPMPPIDVTFEAGISTFDSHFYTLVDIPTRFDSLQANFAGSPATAIRPRTARLLGVFNNVSYDFIRDISVRICSDNERERINVGESTECQREVFWRNPVPEDVGTTLDMVPNENDLLSLLSQPTATFQIKLVSPLRGTTTQFVESQLLLEFNVE